MKKDLKKYLKKFWMTHNLKFSVILPIYKKTNYKIFIKSFESILSQSLSPNELLVIYDGPVNGNIKKLVDSKKKTYKFIKILNFPSNNGLGKVLKIAVCKSSYNYIMRCDSDDISLKNRFKDQIAFLKKNNKIDVLGSNIMEIYEKKYFSIKKLPEKSKDLKKFSLFRNPINHSSVIFKKNKIINSGNYLDMPFFEDYYLWLRVLKSGGKFHNIQKNLVLMGVDDNYYDRRSGLKYFINYVNFLNKIRKDKIISYFIYTLNFILRFHIVYLPRSIIRKVYNLILR